MPLATFAPPTDIQSPPSATLSRSQTASRLGIAMGAVDKLVAAHLLQLPIRADVVERIERRSFLVVTHGELTVLRTDARKPGLPGEDRRWMGFSTEHNLDELDETSLRWWRSQPRRVIDNELFVVTVATVPVAVYKIEDVVDQKTRPGEDRPRFHYRGRLLCRENGRMQVDQIGPSVPGAYKDRVLQIMNSRIKVNSGGPIGYLGTT